MTRSLGLLAALLLAGCGASSGAPGPAAPGPASVVRFAGTADVARGVITLAPLEEGTPRALGVLPEGSAADHVDVANAADPEFDAICAAAFSFTGHVQITSHYAGAVLSDAYAVLDTVSGTGVGSCNQSADPGGLAPDTGLLWSYGVIPAGGAVSSDWSFALLNSDSFTFTGHVVANVHPVSTYAVPTLGSAPLGITAGPDGNLWFTETLAGRVGRIQPDGAIQAYPVGLRPFDIAAGPDGALWFTENTSSRVGRITTAGVVTYPGVIAAAAQPSGIVLGPDGNLWFTESAVPAIGRITPAGVVDEFTEGLTLGSSPLYITSGPDGNLWFTEYDGGRIGRITTDGTIDEFAIPGGGVPEGITAAGGKLWFTNKTRNMVGSVTPDGLTFQEFPIPTPAAEPTSIVVGPDGNLWFAENNVSRLGRLTLAGTMTELPLPAGPFPYRVALGADGHLWFTDFDGNQIGVFKF